MSNYNKNIVKKPWGYEYLAYENENVGLWFLHIAHNQSTSMHCHPKKTTGLVVLDGEAEVSFLADKRQLQSLDKVMIRRGLFHSTKALSEQGALIFEIETPVDKQDLVRLNDQYGRVAKPYEDDTFEELKDENCLWIQDPKSEESNVYQFADCTLLIENTSTIDTINNKQDTDLLMFLSGGMVRNVDGTSHCVTIPGDVGFASVVKQVSMQLDGVLPQTILMTITKNKTSNG
jgi:mannose-6-phosphate isomerase-like protein (cupin superfamily)